MRWFWYLGKSGNGADDNGGQRGDQPVGQSPALLAKPPVWLREKPLQTWWSWCIWTLMVHAADLLGHWVHSNNTCCVCLHPWDNLMRTSPLSADSGGASERAAGCSCCHRGFNHSPLSAWHTQDTAVSAGIPTPLLQHPPPPPNSTYGYMATFSFVPSSWLSAQAEPGRISIWAVWLSESTLELRMMRWCSPEQLRSEIPVHFICSGSALRGRSRIKYWRCIRTTSP